jgi:hypothetical protein
MGVAAILGGVDVSKASGYYYYSHMPNCALGYSILPPRRYCALL